MVAGALFASAVIVPGTLLMVVAFALGWEWVGGESLRVMRQVNVRLIAGPTVPRGPLQHQRRHLAAILLDFVRGMIVVGLGLVLLATLLLLTADRLALHAVVARLAVGSVSVGLIAATLGVFGGRVRIFLLGAGLGLLFVLVRG